MRQLGLAIGFLALLALALPFSDAQDKKDPAPAKGADKKDTPDDEKPKKAEPKRDGEDKLVYSVMYAGRLQRLDANSARDFTVAIPEPDPAKLARLAEWQANEMVRIGRINQPQNRAKDFAQYQLQLARKQSTETTTPKDRDFRAADNCKIRTNTPPIRYDERGLLKPYTQKELTALRGKNKLPGYPAEFENLVPGQTVEIYLAKTKDSAKKLTPAKKDGKDDTKPEVVLIHITSEPAK